MSAEGAGQIPDLLEKLGVKLEAPRAIENHMVFVAVEADRYGDSARVRFRRGSGSGTPSITRVSTLEEALTKVTELPTIY